MCLPLGSGSDAQSRQLGIKDSILFRQSRQRVHQEGVSFYLTCQQDTSSQLIDNLQYHLHHLFFTNSWSTLTERGYSVPFGVWPNGWHRRFNGKANGNKLHFYKMVPALIKEVKTVSRQVRLVDEQSCSLATHHVSTVTGTPFFTMGATSRRHHHHIFFLRAVGHMYDIPVPDPEPEEDTDSD
ncbi:unnamed protein product [Mytilus coruscus]|uniref:Uncharacterized protein n=1 Tax=Mytilus coruscus TaxID=42192 RepID=A0A6J8ATN4_MYTCO|nr:unnamed protein product [Mytilus coruscus]